MAKMIKRLAWAWMPIAGLMLWGLEARLCAAQPGAGGTGAAGASGTAGGQGGTAPGATGGRAAPPAGTSPYLPQPTPPPASPSPSATGAAGTAPGTGTRAGAPGGAALPPALPPGGSIYAPPSGGLPATGPTFLLGDVSIKPAPLESTDLRFPINLATALRLSDARPLIVAAAQASVWVAEAQLTRAKVLWVPTLNVGGDYIRHDGGGPDFNKGIMTAPSINFFYGGAGAIQNVALTDVFFEPLVQRRNLNAKNYDIQAAKNDALFQTATTYFNVHQYRGMYAGALYTVERGHDLIERIAQLSRELVPRVEVDRARNLVADLEQQATMARQNWRVESANLTQVLRLDPRVVIDPIEHDHLQVTLIDPARPLDDLMPVALTNRPELGSQQALVQAQLERVRREKNRPLLPSVLLNGFQTPYEQIQAGIFGLGPNSSMNQWVGRDDFSFQALWQLEGMGIGNLARIKEQRGYQSKQIIEFYKTQDMVAADVFRALARLQSAAARVSQADRALRTAIITFNGNFEGLHHTVRFGDVLVLVNRPQEVVFALQLMKIAFDEYFTTVADYNKAQFELFHAIGYPARELAQLRPPGEVVPVNTDRPGFLPPVGNGPPPATR
jgi:outer membrane protein TolC